MANKVVLEIRNNIGLVKLNSPESLNALSVELLKDLNATIDEIENNLDVKVIVLTGEGRGFSAGGDVKGMGDRTTLESVEKIKYTTNSIVRVSEIKKPVIAMVNGFAMGAGFSLALASDIIIAENHAKFGLSFINVGLVPDCGLLHFLPKIVGPWKAKELIFSGAVLTADEAFRYNIVNQLVEKGEGMTTAIEFSEKLAKGPVQTMSLTKEILKNSQYQDLRGTIQYENYAQSILQQTEDHKEGIRAFREKRTPIFIGK